MHIIYPIIIGVLVVSGFLAFKAGSMIGRDVGFREGKKMARQEYHEQSLKFLRQARATELELSATRAELERLYARIDAPWSPRSIAL